MKKTNAVKLIVDEETHEKPKPIPFYPRAIAEERITIKEFFGGLLKGKIRCLNEKFEIEDELRGERKWPNNKILRM
jgi:hypothetical protein